MSERAAPQAPRSGAASRRLDPFRDGDAPPAPVFLGRRTYRRRRLMDAARMLPVLGGMLLCLPVLWAHGLSEGGTASGMVYMFGIWAFLIVLAAVMARKLTAPDDRLADPPDPAKMDHDHGL